MKTFKQIPPEISESIGYSSESPSGLIWIKSPNRKIKIGSPAGCLKPTGYWEIRFNKKEYLAHRVVWFLKTGNMPEDKIIDHKDHNPSNNKIENLREVTSVGNSSNIRGWSNKESGLPKGIFSDKRTKGSFSACIVHEGKSYTKGSKDLELLKSWLSSTGKSLKGDLYYNQ